MGHHNPLMDANRWVCSCIHSSLLSRVPSYSPLQSLRVSHTFQVTSTVSKAGGDGEEWEGGVGDLAPALYTEDHCRLVVVGSSASQELAEGASIQSLGNSPQERPISPQSKPAGPSRMGASDAHAWIPGKLSPCGYSLVLYHVG